MATIYRARWKSHDCVTGDLRISKVGPYFRDQYITAPKIIMVLYVNLALSSSLGLHLATIQLHMTCSSVLFMKHQDVNIDRFMWFKVHVV